MNLKLAIPQNFTYVILLSTAFFVFNIFGLPKSLENIIPVIMMLVTSWLAIIDLRNISKEKKAVMLSGNPDKQRKIFAIVNKELRPKRIYTVFYIIIFALFFRGFILTLLM